MKQIEVPNKYDNEIINTDEVLGTDIKINPDFYIHTAILKAQYALTKDNVKEGFLQYRVLIEHIEVLCKAANMIDDDYIKEIEKYKKTDEYKQTEDFIKITQLATKKLELLMKNVFSNKIATDPLKI